MRTLNLEKTGNRTGRGIKRDTPTHPPVDMKLVRKLNCPVFLVCTTFSTISSFDSSFLVGR
jgi:hypothetical protein